MTEAQFMMGLKDKLMGQVNLVLLGTPHVNDRGSFTLTSGVLDRDPIVKGANGATVNAALKGFVTSAAIELERGIRINVVSPGLLQESQKNMKASSPDMKPFHQRAWALPMPRALKVRLPGRLLLSARADHSFTGIV